jgi:Fe-S cluster assembly protein SufD
MITVVEKISVEKGKSKSHFFDFQKESSDQATEWVIEIEEGASFCGVWRQTHQSVSLQDQVWVRIQAGGSFSGVWWNEDNQKLNRTIKVEFLGEESQAKLYGFTRASGTQTSSTETQLIHHVPNTNASQLFKSIVSDQSISEFQGLVYVKSEAQKTDSNQYSQGLILSDQARVITRPQLEIFADDVKCSHGASIGQLDAEQLLYIQSRGLSEHQAKTLLLKGFYEEIIDLVPDDALRNELKSHVEAA